MGHSKIPYDITLIYSLFIPFMLASDQKEAEEMAKKIGKPSIDYIKFLAYSDVQVIRRKQRKEKRHGKK